MSTMHRRIPRNNQRRGDWRTTIGVCACIALALWVAVMVYAIVEIVR